jgi:hypothetical protein
MSTRHTKHPSTPYLDISPTANELQVYTQSFIGERVTINEKMDGEITSIYQDSSFHARSLDSGAAWQRDIIHSYLPGIVPAMRYDEHFVFENMYGTHTIEYDDLESYLYLLYIVRNGVVISYEQTCSIASKVGLVMPKVLFSGIFTPNTAKEVIAEGDFREGFVIRTNRPFMYADLRRFTAKYVVQGFMQTDVHWTQSEPRRNKLRKP